MPYITNVQNVSALYVLKKSETSNLKRYYKINVKNKCESRSCVWWLVLNLSSDRRNYLFLLNFDISFVSIRFSTFETVILTEALTIPFSLFLLLYGVSTCTARDLWFYLVIERNTRTQDFLCIDLHIFRSNRKYVCGTISEASWLDFSPFI